MQTVLHVSSRMARRSLLHALRERGHEVRVEEEHEAPVWDAESRPDLLVVEVAAGHAGAVQCRRLRNRAAPGGKVSRRDAPYMLAVVAPGGGDDALEAGADSFITGVDAELDAHLALAEQAIVRRGKRAAAEAALVERAWEFRVVADHERDLITILKADAPFRYAFVNRALAAAIGLPADCIVGRTVEEVPLPLDEPAAWAARLAEVVEGKREQTFMAPTANPDRRWYSAALIPELDNAGGVHAVLLIVCTDYARRGDSIGRPGGAPGASWASTRMGIPTEATSESGGPTATA